MDLGGSHLSFCVLLHIFWGAMLQVFELLVTRLSWILAISRSRTPGEKPILMFLTFRNLVPSAPIGPHSEIDVIIFTPLGKLVSKPTSPSSHQPHWSRWSHLSRLPHLSSLSRLSHLSHRTHLSHWSHQSGLSHLSHLCGSQLPEAGHLFKDPPTGCDSRRPAPAHAGERSCPRGVLRAGPHPGGSAMALLAPLPVSMLLWQGILTNIFSTSFLSKAQFVQFARFLIRMFSLVLCVCIFACSSVRRGFIVWPAEGENQG